MPNARIVDYQILLPAGGEAIIRAGTKRDAAGLRELEQAVRGDPRAALCTLHELAGLIVDHAEDPNRLWLVVEVDGRIVAELRCGGSGLGRLRVQVHPQWRRRGIGASLLMTLLAWARASARVEHLALWVLPEDGPALAFYRRFGFRVVSPKAREGNVPDSLLLSRDAR